MIIKLKIASFIKITDFHEKLGEKSKVAKSVQQSEILKLWIYLRIKPLGNFVVDIHDVGTDSKKNYSSKEQNYFVNNSLKPIPLIVYKKKPEISTK